MGEGQVLHFGAVRNRITGSGTFLQVLISLNDISSFAVPNLTLLSATDREPVLLTNFISQRGCLLGTVMNVGEGFVISRIIVYIRPIASEYPA